MRERSCLVTGGERSGKSSFALSFAKSLAPNPLYVATARHWDSEFSERIAKHRADRGPEWETREEEKQLSALTASGRVLVIDCLTLWLTNIYTDFDYDLRPSLEYAQTELNGLFAQDAVLILVSNELGMGVHANTETSRRFVSLQGWINQYVAEKIPNVVLMVSGIPVSIKGTAAV
jgi:adenosylcobinamide kinase / adenosylcobinamide-phosphate guanylyltransferase